MQRELVIVGGGSAALGAARSAVRDGVRPLIITEGPPGGDCTFTGCVSSKTLIESARRGLSWPAAAERVRAVVAQIAATEDEATLRAEGIEVLRGRARFLTPTRIDVAGQPISAEHVILTTGSRPVVPDVPGLAEADPLTNENVFDLDEAPASVILLGGGAIGCELGQALARLGCTVTLVESADRLLGREEPEASAIIAEALAADGVVLRLGTSLTRVGPGAGGVAGGVSDGVTAEVSTGPPITAERILVAVGRRPQTEGLELAAAGIEVDERGYVVTDRRLATTAEQVYAAGDVVGKLQFTHAAFEMGRIAAGNALHRLRRAYHPESTPWVTFTEPEVARVGATEAEAAEHGGRVAYLPLAEMDRAITAGATNGYVKLITGPQRVVGRLGGGKIIGATIVAERAGEMIHEPALAMATGMFAGRLATATHAYPTWSYGIQLAAAQFFMEIGGRVARPAVPAEPGRAGA